MVGVGGETMNLALALVKVALALAVVVGLLVVAVRLARRFGLGQLAGIAGQGDIRVIESKMIAPKRYVTVVAVGSELLALGVSEQNVNLLCRLDTPPGAPDEEVAADATAKGFRTVLAAARNKKDCGPEKGNGVGKGHEAR